MSASPTLFRVTVEVAGLERAAAFYTSLFGVAGRDVRGGRYYLECGQVVLALVGVASAGQAPRSGPGDLYFAVDDLDAFHERARELSCLSVQEVHGKPAGEIATRPWGERSFYAEDPFGNGLCFVDATTIFTGR
jgi:predicted enzyme related to lactoylglutathione lyase